MATECNGCGCCCDPVILLYNKIEGLCDPRLPDDEKKWLREDLTPMSRREASTKDTHYNDPNIVWIREGKVREVNYYACRHFDPATRQCANWENRPNICRGYPWYGGLPVESKALPKPCAFRVDIGQPVELITKPGAS